MAASERRRQAVAGPRSPLSARDHRKAAAGGGVGARGLFGAAMPVTTALATDLPYSAPSASRQQIIDLLADFSIETTPAAVARHGGLGLLPAATRVYIAFVPGEDWRNVVAAASQVRAANLVPVPHLP